MTRGCGLNLGLNSPGMLCFPTKKESCFSLIAIAALHCAKLGYLSTSKTSLVVSAHFSSMIHVPFKSVFLHHYYDIRIIKKE